MLDGLIRGMIRGDMRYESKFSAWIRSGGQSEFVVLLNRLGAPETKFTVTPDRLLDGIIDDALAAAVTHLNSYLPGGVSVDITSVDLTSIRDEIRGEVADRLTEIGVVVNSNDPVITSIIARYAERLNASFRPKRFGLLNIFGAVAMMRVSDRSTHNMMITYFRGPILRKMALQGKHGTAGVLPSRSLMCRTYQKRQSATY